MTEPAMQTDALEVLTVDHRTVENLFALYESTGTEDVEAPDKVVREIVRELSIHAAVEEQLLYPLMRERLADGERLVREALDEHQEVKETLASIEKADPGADERSSALVSLIRDVRHHVEEEEGDLFPKLRAAASPEELRDLAGRIESAKRTAPTRPHPGAPNTPPGNVVAGAVAGVVDRIRDGVREGVEDAEKER